MKKRQRPLVAGLSLILTFSLLPARSQSTFAARFSDAQDKEKGQQLEPHRPIEREMSGGQSHSYQITLSSGQYFQLVVDQRGIDVVVTLFAPDGRKVSEVDSPNGTSGPETLSAITDAAGIYRIEVRSLEKTAESGRYEIKLVWLRAATTEDKYLVAAESASREAEPLRIGNLADRRKSIVKFEEARDLFRRAGDRLGEAQALNDIGEICYSLGERQKALEKFNEALPLRRSMGYRKGEAESLNDMGVVYWSMGEMKKALEMYDAALPIRRSVGDIRGVAESLHNIALIYLSQADTQKALEKLNETLPIKHAVGDRNGEAITLNSIGLAYSTQGEIEKALEYYNKSLPIRRAVGDRGGEAITLANIALAYYSLGEIQVALEKYNEALAITRETGNRYAEVLTLDGIGTIYLSSGDKQKAQEKFKEALPICRAIGDRNEESGILTNIGMSHYLLGEMQKALEKYNEALPISRAVGNRQFEGEILRKIGMVYFSLGDLAKALQNYNESLLINRAIGDRNSEADILLGMAQVEEKRGNLTQARQISEECIRIIESQRANIHDQKLRESYLATQQGIYKSYIDILMQLHRQNPAAGFDSTALEVSERARARSLLELLTEGHVDIRQGVDSSLLERERSLQRRLRTVAAAQINLMTRAHTTQQAEAAAKEIAAVTAEYDDLEAQIRSNSPRYAALTQPQPLNLSEIQQQVLDPETLLLEYSLGEEASYLFVASQTSLTSYQLPKRSEIEAATRQVRQLLTAPQYRQGETAASLQARIREARANYWPQASALSRMVLGPAATQLGSKRLLIVADGALQYLPFGALPVPGRAGSGRAGERKSGRPGEVEKMNNSSLVSRSPALPLSHSPALPLSHSSVSPRSRPLPLIAKHEIIHLPSASTMAVLRRELAGRRPAPKAVAVLADPVFSADDNRVKLATLAQNSRSGKETQPELSRALTDFQGGLTRLLMTREEAQAILSITPPSTHLAALDFRASRATTTGEELSQYRIVHFATHGLLNNEHPDLSGLVLSLVDERGQPEDGFLQLREVYNLRLPAELVVLSACQTGLGKDI
ncbi:MAG: tetratricopeptide repeat protein, partial [Blastocatellia bacterium]|nr:tetratricopeptide repeat protein [Blastocatellia bacterium]